MPVFLDKVADFLKSESYVNQSYAAACIEKLLLRKTTSPDASGQTGIPIFTPVNIMPEVL